jgi:APA family basic amino acid/polyamine antiporter
VSVQAQATESEPQRVVGLLGALSIVAGSMLGIGIFLTPRVVADLLHTPAWFLGAWVLGGVIALSGAVAYAELGTMFPRAGGDYVFLRESFGRSVSFACGWVLFAGVFTGSIATIAVPVCQYQLPALLAPWVDVQLAAPMLFGLTGTQLFAMALVVLFTLLNVLGARPAAQVQIFVTGIPLAILAVAAVGLLLTGPHASAVPTTAATPTEGNPLVALSRATLAIYFAYAGWNAIGYVGGEVKHPQRTIPLALVGGTVLITGLYLTLCAAFIAVLGMGGLTAAFEAGTATAAHFGGTASQWFVTALIFLALVGSLNGTILGGARIAQAMAQDGALWKPLGNLSPRFHSPGRALWLQAGMSCALVASGTFEQLIELTSIAMLLIGGLTVVSLFALRARRPLADRPWKAWGYPFLPIFYLVTCLAVVGVSIWRVIGPVFGSGANTPHLPDFGELLPLLGLAIFALAWLGHRLWGPAPAQHSQG